MTRLLAHLERSRAGGRKLLVPYLMAGVPDPVSFPEAIDEVARHADVVEVGLPYSDPLMDGPVIAAAGDRAIRAGVGPVKGLELGAPGAGDGLRVVMTYYNPIHRAGEETFCKRASELGYAGVIVPDLPLEESISLRAAAGEHGLAWIPLVAPTSSPHRVASIVATATGFVYAVSTLGVTGTRSALSDRAARVVSACRAETDLPVLVGIGVSSPEQARKAAEAADGVVIGSAVVRAVVQEGAVAAGAWLAGVRTALDSL